MYAQCIQADRFRPLCNSDPHCSFVFSVLIFSFAKTKNRVQSLKNQARRAILKTGLVLFQFRIFPRHRADPQQLGQVQRRGVGANRSSQKAGQFHYSRQILFLLLNDI